MLDFNQLQQVLYQIYNTVPIRVVAIPKYGDDQGRYIPKTFEVFGDGNKMESRLYDEEGFDEYDYDYKVTLGFGE